MGQRDIISRAFQLRGGNQRVIDLVADFDLALASPQLLIDEAPHAARIEAVTTAAFVGANTTDAQKIFGAISSNGAVQLAADSTYAFDQFFALIRSAGTNAHTTATLFAYSGTLASIAYWATGLSSTSASTGSDQTGSTQAATAYTCVASSSTATENSQVRLSGIIRTTTAGLLIPQFQYSAAPGGAPTIQPNAWFRAVKIGDAALATLGTWS